MIERINRDFVATWILIDDAQKRAAEGDPLASTLSSRWEYPLDLMFLSANGRFLSKLNSFHDLRDAHPDVWHPPEGRGRALPHLDVFLKHIDELLKENGP